MNLFKRIFTKEKEYNWIDIRFEKKYDISSMPDLSQNSPIKHFKMFYIFRYCPINDKLMKRSLTNAEWFDVNLEDMMNQYSELKERIYELTIDKRRDKLITEILDNKQ
jgi:hypothetical protein